MLVRREEIEDVFETAEVGKAMKRRSGRQEVAQDDD
jgi:hypothetical protein